MTFDEVIALAQELRRCDGWYVASIQSWPDGYRLIMAAYGLHWSVEYQEKMTVDQAIEWLKHTQDYHMTQAKGNPPTV